MFVSDHRENVDYCRLLGVQLDGTSEQKAQAEKSLRKWSEEYGVDPALMYKIIKTETAGTFRIKVYNEKTQARGLCQLTEAAIRDLPFGRKYFTVARKFEDGVLVSEHLVLYLPRVYDIDWNIRGGCAYLARCKVLGPRIRRSMPAVVKMHLSEEDVVVLCYAWGFGNIREWISALGYLKGIK